MINGLTIFNQAGFNLQYHITERKKALYVTIKDVVHPKILKRSVTCQDIDLKSDFVNVLIEM